MGSHLGWEIVKPETPRYICTTLKIALVDEFAAMGSVDELYGMTFHKANHPFIMPFLRGYLRGTPSNSDQHHEASAMYDALNKGETIRLLCT